ncbi:hypothetical protein E1211_29430 [Micromonospora sp. 15K316]|uniref:hypothetical protein n=1 Tax=Micromonospora sp. 15K316 TaxID=2530376 RepID=UPI0010536037|nr:hypothetical protein [Micromonospora sp. 15K316]TDC27189.1 hypothetical protein E1211_29430 [Micromonospora sp. 15K316]
MTRSIRGSRRAALLLSGVAAATSLLLSGCGAGQISETANKVPSVQGVNIETEDGLLAVRGLLVDFPGVEGYRAGEDALLNAVIYNDSKEPVTVTVTSQDAREVVLTGTGASASPTPSGSPSESASPSGSASPSDSGSPSGSASPSDSASPSPSAPAGEPARFEIAPLSYIQLNQQSDRMLQLLGLNESLHSGQNVFVTFDFGNGRTITGPAPIAVPLTPAAPPSPIVHREGGEGGEEGGAEGGGHGG